MKKPVPSAPKAGRGVLATVPQSPEFDVGYAKPPEASRFKPGASGNPKGRPKGRKNKMPALNEERLKVVILEEAYRTIKVNDGNRQVSVPMAQAIVRSLAVNAAKGNTRAQRLFAEMLSGAEASNKRLYDEWLDTALTYKVEWENELERRRLLGIVAPEPVPHPDHIHINMRTGMVEVRGPLTKHEKAIWDDLAQRRAEYKSEIERLLLDKADPEFAGLMCFVDDEIAHFRKLVGLIDNAFERIK